MYSWRWASGFESWGVMPPPAWERDARAFLVQNGTRSDVIDRLVQRRPLTVNEVREMARYNNVAVLHLLAENPGVPENMLRKFAMHSNLDVRTGVAANRSAPLDLLLALRTPGKYSTLNEHIACNPQVPSHVLMEMYRNGEASDRSFVINQNCPTEIMRTVARVGRDIDRAWLATNPNLPDDIIQGLSRDPSSMVRNHLATNPKSPKHP